MLLFDMNTFEMLNFPVRSLHFLPSFFEPLKPPVAESQIGDTQILSNFGCTNKDLFLFDGNSLEFVKYGQ